MVDIWDEMLYLMIFNIIWLASTIPGLLLLIQGTTLPSIIFILLGLILLLPWPFVTFGLFLTVYDIGEAKGIGFGKFWGYGRHMWRQAYIWGGINLVVFMIAWVNWAFYGRLEAEWAGLAQIFVLAFIIFWVIVQLVALPFYARLEQPGLKLALRNAGVTIGRYPLPVFCLVIVMGLILAISAFFPIVLFLGAFSIIAVVANRVVAAVVAKEERRQQQVEG